ncbi:MAG: hypothetical protein A2W74_08185 [Planctomycetes bacterium RIFCSPLOWO2_12_38_17]|nr:MAG: hypothetical protein A2W74_08185 [Planctomycetes bacterium RIFCSPLOWO2_12_38_17]
MNQQKQTLSYFNQNAADWQRAASANNFSVIDNRHNAVLEIMKAHTHAGQLLDVGCGTGQLAIEASKKGWHSVGIDYAASMIDICKLNNREAGTDAEFHCVSFFDFAIKPASYDIVSAQGFIEYISLAELDKFLRRISKGLKRGGAIALGSRNRLFNLHSLNEFSLLELQLNTVGKLLHEAIIMQSSKSQQEAIEGLTGLNYEYSHPDTHPETGIKVETRFQFSPADLIGRLTKHGLKPTRIFPVHFHGLPLSLTKDDKLSALHAQLADLVGKQYINSHEFVPYSSSFVIEAKKD